MANHNTVLVQDNEHDNSDLLYQLQSASTKKQLQIITEIANQEQSDLAVLMEFLRSCQGKKPNLSMGKAYQALYRADSSQSRDFLATYFPQGIVPLASAKNLDYQPLQQLIAQQDFQAADRLTLQKLCELAGNNAVERGWLYFTEVEKFPTTDLQTINNLWLLHSEGKFGFSVQREIWLAVGKNFAKLWPKIGWKTDNNWTRYPHEFVWDLSAPKGHLPLSNQLRGVRVMASVLAHPAWSTEVP